MSKRPPGDWFPFEARLRIDFVMAKGEALVRTEVTIPIAMAVPPSADLLLRMAQQCERAFQREVHRVAAEHSEGSRGAGAPTSAITQLYEVLLESLPRVDEHGLEVVVTEAVKAIERLKGVLGEPAAVSTAGVTVDSVRALHRRALTSQEAVVRAVMKACGITSVDNLGNATIQRRRRDLMKRRSKRP